MIRRFMLAVGFLLPLALASAAAAAPQYGLSIFGDLKYGPGFQHFDYVNPNAPKGGELRLPSIDSFDSITPFILKGVAADGLNLGASGISFGLPIDTILIYRVDMGREAAITKMIRGMKADSAWYGSIQEKARAKDVPMDTMLRMDAVYLIDLQKDTLQPVR